MKKFEKKNLEINLLKMEEYYVKLDNVIKLANELLGGITRKDFREISYSRYVEHKEKCIEDISEICVSESKVFYGYLIDFDFIKQYNKNVQKVLIITLLYDNDDLALYGDEKYHENMSLFELWIENLKSIEDIIDVLTVMVEADRIHNRNKAKVKELISEFKN